MLWLLFSGLTGTIPRPISCPCLVFGLTFQLVPGTGLVSNSRLKRASCLVPGPSPRLVRCKCAPRKEHDCRQSQCDYHLLHWYHLLPFQSM